MSITPYNLLLGENNSDKYYEIIAALSERIILDAENQLAGIINEYEQYILNSSTEKKRKRNEYIIEAMIIGVLWNMYISNAMASQFVINKFSQALSTLKTDNPKTESEVSKLKIQIINDYLLSHSDEPPIADFTNFKLLIDWLLSASHFGEEVLRMMKWEEYLNTLDETKISSILNKIINFAFDFTDNAFSILHTYTAGVIDFLEKSIEDPHRDDVIMRERSEEEYHLNMIAAYLMNKLQRENVKSAKNKIVLLPICMNTEIKSDNNEDLHAGCIDNKCNIGKINNAINELKNENIRVMAIDHNKGYSKHYMKWAGDPDTAVIAVSCVLSLISTALELRRLDISFQVMPLDFSSCRKHWDTQGTPTNLNINQLLSMLK